MGHLSKFVEREVVDRDDSKKTAFLLLNRWDLEMESSFENLEIYIYRHYICDSFLVLVQGELLGSASAYSLEPFQPSKDLFNYTTSRWIRTFNPVKSWPSRTLFQCLHGRNIVFFALPYPTILGSVTLFGQNVRFVRGGRDYKTNRLVTVGSGKGIARVSSQGGFGGNRC